MTDPASALSRIIPASRLVETAGTEALAAVLADGGAPFRVEAQDGALHALALARRLGETLVAAFALGPARILAPPEPAASLLVLSVLDGAATIETPATQHGIGAGETLALRLDGPARLVTDGAAAVMTLLPENRVGPLPRFLAAIGPIASESAEARVYLGHVAAVALSLPPGEGAGRDGVRETVGRHVVDLVRAMIARAAGEDGAGASRAGRGTRLMAARRIVEAQLAQPTFSLARAARQLGVSPRYVQKLFEETGTTFSAYVMERRLERARDLLAGDRRGDAAIREIAYATGFSDASHFTRAFRRRFGQTPSQARGTATDGTGEDGG